MDKGTLEMYEKEYEIYFDSLKEGDEVLSLKEYIECLTWKKRRMKSKALKGVIRLLLQPDHVIDKQN